MCGATRWYWLVDAYPATIPCTDRFTTPAVIIDATADATDRWVAWPNCSGIELSYPTRRASLFDKSYVTLAEQAGTSLWTVDERFYNSARASGLGFEMHPGRDPLP
jgi:hypothetical protein